MRGKGWGVGLLEGGGQGGRGQDGGIGREWWVRGWRGRGDVKLCEHEVECRGRWVRMSLRT